MAPRKKVCAHQKLCVDVSDHGRNVVGFEWIPADKRAAATTRSGRATEAGGSAPDVSTFPGPLVLPGDELAMNPKYPPQSLRSWVNGGYRNPITPERKTLYVVDLPGIDESAGFMREWAEPDIDEFVDRKEFPRLEHPDVGDLMAYLGAFYHPLPVKKLPTPLKFVRWNDGKKGEEKPSMVGLMMGSDIAVGIRARPSPDEIARMQLNLNDLLDALRSILPKGAYASVMVLAHDLYEDEDDDFCCGRAYGGSRISLVSSFRYRPDLDAAFDVEIEHMWPTSHCAAFIDDFCKRNAEEEDGKGKKRKRAGGSKAASEGNSLLDLKKTPGTPMGAAISESKKVLVPKTKKDQRGMWFSRVARTAAHELGHCFGLDHCVYYACVMQGTGGLGEDARQPPYFCPVCEAKLMYGLGEMGVVEGGKFGKWEEARDKEVLKERVEIMWGFCQGWKGVGMFAGFGEWLDVRLKEM
ncbi:Archaemetzincin-2 [Colletotrichum truncatum]|uniref:Archaemetzincin-2 n=1 Tax=Colletotrichum truncatum TaxID=5467 RepID=A0ACC3YQZ8_COLTU|nr:Archaemetzincin-2 [Colletotrichum truncatum]KAF6799061.1 Archaemetzincin-2 [Colletotrichum truncatum]